MKNEQAAKALQQIALQSYVRQVRDILDNIEKIINVQIGTEKKLLTAEQVAEMLGDEKITSCTIMDMCRKGEIPYYELQKKYLFDIGKVIEAIHLNTVRRMQEKKEKKDVTGEFAKIDQYRAKRRRRSV